MSVSCPKHGNYMTQVQEGNVVVDVCHSGCTFFDPDELQHFVNFTLAQQGLPPQPVILPVSHHGQPVGHSQSGGLGGLLGSLGSMFGHGAVCPKHRQSMRAVRGNNVEIDVCPLGCTFFDPGELQQYMAFYMGHHGHHQSQTYLPPVPKHGRVSNPHGYVFGHRGQGHHNRRHSNSGWGSIFSGGSGWGSSGGSGWGS